MVSWGCWAEQAQSCSSSSFRNVTSRTPQRSRSQSGATGPKTDLRIIIFKKQENSLRLECPDANGPGLLRAGPSGEERCTLHHTVPVSPQCPQEIGLLTLPVFQGAAVSSEPFSQSLPARNAAELGGWPSLRGSLEQLDRPSPAIPPLQGTELATLSTPEASIERLVPLVGHLAVWEPLPSVSSVAPAKLEQTLVL